MPRTSRDKSSAAIEALLSLSLERGWHSVSLAGIAERSGLSLAALHQQYGGKTGILAAFLQGVDEAILQDGVPSGEEGVRDRLFDLVMRRFDAFQPHRESLRVIFRDLAIDPLSWPCGGARLLKTVTLILESAGISASGPIGRLKAKGMAAVYVAALRAWLKDESPDMAKTMAALDRSLRRAEWVAGRLWGGHYPRGTVVTNQDP